MKKYDVIIVGGGASGLACAVALSKNKNLKILILEAGERAGKKLAATGNGQGNIGNDDLDISHYRSGNPDLVKSIISGNGEEVFKAIFGALPLSHAAYGRIYPAGKQASALVDILLARLNRSGVGIALKSKVTEINRGFTVLCESGEKYAADFVVLATGGKAQKQFGTDGSAYKLAERLGHKITPLYPSIVQLKTDTTHIKTLKGIRAQCRVLARSEGREKSFTGDIIFTDYGVSGNAIFYVSPLFASRGGTLEIDFLPDFEASFLIQTLESRLKEGVQESDLLSGILHNQIGRSVIRRSSGNIPSIVKTAKNFTLNVTGTLGFDYAQVTQGGVEIKQITDKLESKLCKNLFFTGEILDVDGDCGGYNLYWAFTSALAVAHAILGNYEKA